MTDNVQPTVQDCSIQLCVARRLQELPKLADEILTLKMDHYHNRESLDPDTFSAEVDDVLGQLLAIDWPTHMNPESGTMYRLGDDELIKGIIPVSRHEFAGHALGPLTEYLEEGAA